MRVLGVCSLIALMCGAVLEVAPLGASNVRDVAARSDAALYVVLVSFEAAAPPVPRNWLTHRDTDLDTLREAAESTGGELRQPGLTGVKLVTAFAQVFDAFRESYVLRYTPTGVRPWGWHEIDVKISKSSRYTIRARRGYFGV